jgi:predicted DNA-binding transcriptional regulator AlpA
MAAGRPVLSPLLTEKQVAELLNVTVACLRAWRQRGRGPQPIKIGSKLVRYHESAVSEFIKAGANGGQAVRQ